MYKRPIPAVEVRLLGPLEVGVAGRRFELPSQKQRALLALLALRVGEVLSTDRLVEDLWGADPPKAPLGSLQSLVWELRKALGPDALATRPPGYVLEIERERVDVHRFETLIRAAEGTPAEKAMRLREALALWRGPALADLAFEPFAQAEISRLEELRAAAQEDLFDAELAVGRHVALVADLEAFVAHHPLRERSRGQLMLALYRSGRQGDALEAYRSARETLVEELGIDPSPELQRLEQSILRHEPSLAIEPPAPALPRQPDRRKTPTVGNGDSSTLAAPLDREVLPAGTITLLFADIERSTALLQQLGPERFGAVRAEFRRLLRDAVASHGGVEVDTEGDAFFAAFPSARRAVAGATQAQEALAGGGLRVRMGLHTGEPLVVDEEYAGIDVHRTARIAAAGHGGQVILSQRTRELLDATVATSDLGLHRLKDLGHPERLYQLGEGEFPPLRSLDPTNLPSQPTPLIGRERELAEAGRLLRTHRLLTLTGPGGSGKTRLALQLAADAQEDFSGRVVWVPLQAVRDPELVLPTIARALTPGDDDTLLAVDNFEQVLEAAPRVADLLEQTSALTLLVTSREPLHIASEHEYPVAPLHEPEAVELFTERATAVRPDFVADAAVAEICRRLDCLPLALELASARVKALSVGELLRRLDRRLPILTGGPRDAPERQRTLRATIAWSHELLTAEEQRVFARLAVFAGGCTLDAAEAVCETDLDTVAALIDKSLLYREGDRYLMLETIGEYALERLEKSGELDVLRRRHAEYYLERARSVEDLVRSPQAARALDELERDYGNLRAALDRLSGETLGGPLRLAIWGLAARLHGLGDLELDRRDAIEAARLYRESLEIGLQLKDDVQIAYCLAGLAAVSAQRGRLDQAARLWGSVLGFERTSGALLNEAERHRYERALGNVEHGSDTSAECAQGSAMTLDEAVEYALATVE